MLPIVEGISRTRWFPLKRKHFHLWKLPYWSRDDTCQKISLHHSTLKCKRFWISARMLQLIIFHPIWSHINWIERLAIELGNVSMSWLILVSRYCSNLQLAKEVGKLKSPTPVPKLLLLKKIWNIVTAFVFLTTLLHICIRVTLPLFTCLLLRTNDYHRTWLDGQREWWPYVKHSYIEIQSL